MTKEVGKTKITITQIAGNQFRAIGWKWSIDYDGETINSGDPRAMGAREFVQVDHAAQAAVDNLKLAQNQRNIVRRATNAGGAA